MQAQADGSGNSLPTFHDFMDEALRERISEAVTKVGGSKAAGEIVGVSDEAIARWRKGPVKPPFPGVVALCHAARFHVEWMATGEGPRDIQSEDALSHIGTDRERNGQEMAEANFNAANASDLRLLPKLTVEPSAGSGLIPAREDIDGYVAISEEYLREIGVDPRYAHVLRVSGRSMAPTINDKDVVIIDTSVRAAVNEGVYTLVYGEAVLIKRIRLLRDGGVTLVSDNKSEGYLDENVPRSELATLSIVGRVKGHIRAL